MANCTKIFVTATRYINAAPKVREGYLDYSNIIGSLSIFIILFIVLTIFCCYLGLCRKESKKEKNASPQETINAIAENIHPYGISVATGYR